MKKKKQVYYDFTYYVVLPTRKSQVIFDDDKCLFDIKKDIAFNQYLDKNNINLMSMESFDGGKALLLELKIHPDNSVSSVIFNFRRYSFRIIKKDKKIMDKLHGEESIWTRDFIVGIDINDVKMKYDEFMKG